MAVVKSILGAFGLLLYSIIVKMIFFALVVISVYSGWGWFWFFWPGIFYLLANLSIFLYCKIADWANNSRFSVTFSAVVITCINVFDIIWLIINKILETPVITFLDIIVNITQIMFVIEACSKLSRKKIRKHNPQDNEN